jgi:hypothetical protein
VAPDRACEGRCRVVARKSPASPANRPLAAKAASVPAAAGAGSRTEPDAAGFAAAGGVGVPVLGTNLSPAKATAPSATNTR